MPCANDSTISIYNDCFWYKFVYNGGDDDGRIDYLIKKNVTMQYVNANEWWIRENSHTQYFTYDQISTVHPSNHVDLHELLTILKNWACLDADGSLGSSSGVESRMKVSNCLNIFNAQFRYNKQELLFDEKRVGSNALVKYTSDPPVVTLWLGAGGVNNNRVIFQSKQYMPYQAEDEICTSIGGLLRTVLDVPNCTARIGYYDDTADKVVNCDTGGSGAFFELDPAGVLYCVVRYFDAGVQTDIRIPQSDWNIDHLDGDGNSGIILDITKSQIFLLSMQMNGGCVKFGFNIDCEMVWVHTFKVANTLYSPTTFNYSLPLRGEIRQSGPIPVTCYQKWYSCSVSLEGCSTEIPVVPFNYTAHAPLTCPVKILTNPGDHRPLIAIRLKKNLCRASIWPKRIEVTNESGSMIYWRLILNPVGFKDTDSPAPVWYDLGNSSFAQYSYNLNNVGFDNGDGLNPDEHDTNNRDALAIIIGSIMDAAGVLLAGRTAALEAAQSVLVDQTPLVIPLTTPVAQMIIDAAIEAANSTQTDEVNVALTAQLAALIVSTTSTVNTAVTSHIAAKITLANTTNGGTPAVLTAAHAAAAALPYGTSAQVVSAVNAAVSTAIGVINSALTSGVAAGITGTNSAISAAATSGVSTAITTYVQAAVTALVGNPSSIPAAVSAGNASLAAGGSSVAISTAAINAALAVDPTLSPNLIIGTLSALINTPRSASGVQTALATAIGTYTDTALAGPAAKIAAQAAAAAGLTAGDNTTTILGSANTAAQGVETAVNASYVSGATALTNAIDCTPLCISDAAFAAGASPAEIQAAVTAGLSHASSPFGLLQGGSTDDINTAAKNALQTAVAAVVTTLTSGLSAAVTSTISAVNTASSSFIDTAIANSINALAISGVTGANVIAYGTVTSAITAGASPASIATAATAAAVAEDATVNAGANAAAINTNNASLTTDVTAARFTNGGTALASSLSSYITSSMVGSTVLASIQAAASTSLNLSSSTLTTIVNTASASAITAQNAVYTAYTATAGATYACITTTRYSNSSPAVITLITNLINGTTLSAAAKTTALTAALVVADASLLAGDNTTDIATDSINAAVGTLVNVTTQLTSGVSTLISSLISAINITAAPAMDTAITAAITAVGGNAGAITAAVTAGNLALAAGSIPSVIATAVTNAAVVADPSIAATLTANLTSTTNAIAATRHSTIVQNAIKVPTGTYTDAALAGTAAKAAARAAAVAALLTDSTPTQIANAAKVAAQQVMVDIATALAASTTSDILMIKDVINKATADRLEQLVSSVVLSAGGSPTNASGAQAAAAAALAVTNSTSAQIILAVRDYLVSQSVSNAIIDIVILSLSNSAYSFGDIDIAKDVSAYADNQNVKSVILASGFMSTGIDKDVSDLFKTFGVHANIGGDVPDVLALTCCHVKGAGRVRGSIEFVETQ